jgi:hypothetical protein
MKETTRKTIKAAVIAAAISATVGIVGLAVAGSQQKDSTRKQINADMIYMPANGNGVCNVIQGTSNSCMVDVVVTYADGVKRSGFGVFVGNNLIATDYELVTGHGDSHAVKPKDGHTYTVVLSDGTTHKAEPWAFVPGSVAVLQAY